MRDHIKKLKNQKKVLMNLIRAEGCETHRLLFRHIHIAECLLRGRSMKEIENYNREGNKPKEIIYRCFMEESDSPEIPYLYIKRKYDECFKENEAG